MTISCWWKQQTSVKRQFLRAKIGLHAGAKTADHIPPQLPRRHGFLVVQTKSLKGREHMNDREKLFGHVRPKDLTNEAKLQKAEIIAG